MLTDCHVHLDEATLQNGFQYSFYNRDQSLGDFRVISNSTDEQSSLNNLKLSETSSEIFPFVGIHPQAFLNWKPMDRAVITERARGIYRLLESAAGLGEIGLDPKYGEVDSQVHLFTEQLQLAERKPMPISIHSKASVRKCMELLKSHAIKGKVLFHWFAGEMSELKQVHEAGYFSSFGPTMIFSKRLQALVAKSDHQLILAETDSPLPIESVGKGFVSTPFLVSSVIFKMAEVLRISFAEMNALNEANATEYLGTQD